MQILKKILKAWLPLAIVITGLSALAYATIQQTHRQGANDPQIQMAEDAATALSSGQPVDSLVLSNQIDVARSLSPFMIVYSSDETPLAWSGLLHGQVPSLPDGVLDFARQNGGNRLTWQPEPGVRIATVIVAYDGPEPGFVLAGRSLREVELRESQASTYAFIAWLVTLAGSLLMVAFSEFFLTGKAG